MRDHPDISRTIGAYVDAHAPLLLLMLTPEGRIVDANRHARRVIGDEMVGAPITDVVLDFTGSFDLASLSQAPDREHLLSVAAASREPQSYRFVFTPAAGHVLAFGRLDADELEHMRQEVLALNQELNNLTRELHRKNAQLKRLNEEKNRFLGMAAHDLRKPIGLVISYSEFLMDEAGEVLDPEQIGFLNTINAACTYMKRLVDDFLDVSAIEAGRFELELERAAMDEVINRSLELNRLQARKKEIRLDIRLAPQPPAVTMDSAKIEQVITNLVSNAIEHSHAGGRVVVRLEADREALTLAVQDFGPGIPAGEMDRLFKPFARTSVKKTAGEKSTGLGMLITRKIIDAHQGKIWAESRVGHGTTIRFRLPLRRTPE